MAKYNYSLVVVGAGAGGLVVAIGAAKAGKKVLLIDRGTWGGDCTNFGCIPSKALIASAHQAHAAREIGLTVPADFGVQALKRTREIVAQVREHEEPPALKEKGVEVLEGVARFVDPHTIEVDGKQMTAKNIVLAAGSSPRELEGIDSYLTNETLFDLEEIPQKLTVVGGGPIGCEMAQAFARLGSEVNLYHSHDCLLNREEPEAQAVIKEQFINEGIHVHCNAKAEIGNEPVLVSIGRKPNLEELKLDQVGIAFTPKGITVDKFGRTNLKHIYAIGDICGIAPFTHMAENQARTVLTSLLLPWNKKLDRQAVPRVTYTDPEVASAGVLEQDALKHSTTYIHPMSEVDRAITSGRTEGFIKVVTDKWSSKILGVTIVAPRAGEMLQEVTLAMQHKIPLRRLASLIHPYPTYSLGIRQTADKWLTQTVIPALRGK